jgi:hypothetical protein
MGAKRGPVMERVWAKIDKRGPDECWPWTASLKPHGYAQIRDGGKTLLPHRLVCVQAHGPIPLGGQVMHSCDNRACCNPRHLSIGTASLNAIDCWNKGRGFKPPHPGHGRDCRFTKLTEAAVLKIFLSPLYHSEIARQMRTTVTNVCAIRNRETWGHLTANITPPLYRDGRRVD